MIPVLLAGVVRSRAVVTGIANTVFVGICLVGIIDFRAVITDIGDTVRCCRCRARRAGTEGEGPGPGRPAGTGAGIKELLFFAGGERVKPALKGADGHCGKEGHLLFRETGIESLDGIVGIDQPFVIKVRVAFEPVEQLF
jgi:hypothetical protein